MGSGDGVTSSPSLASRHSSQCDPNLCDNRHLLAFLFSFWVHCVLFTANRLTLWELDVALHCIAFALHSTFFCVLGSHAHAVHLEVHMHFCFDA